MQKKVVKILLQGYLAIYNAEALQKEMLAALKKESGIVLDFSQLEELDVSILQLLYSLISEATQKGIPLTFEGPVSDTVKRCFAITGFSSANDLTDEQLFEEITKKTRGAQWLIK